MLSEGTRSFSRWSTMTDAAAFGKNSSVGTILHPSVPMFHVTTRQSESGQQKSSDGGKTCNGLVRWRLLAELAEARLFRFLCPTLLVATVAQAQEWLYTVRPGDNIWNITADYLSSMSYWPKLQKRSTASPIPNACRRG